MSEPAVCEPMASGTMRAATAAHDPPEEPPAVWAGFQGLALSAAAPQANSVVTVFPMITAPARRSSATQAASQAGRHPS